jgi:hypothetical protein
LEDLFDHQLRLAEVVRNNLCNRKKKVLKEIGEKVPQNVSRRTATLALDFARKIARLEAARHSLI